jgi:phenylacetate-CoA ligase
MNELREGTTIAPNLRKLNRTQFARPDELAALRFRKLKALLDHAYSNTAFYRRRFQEAGVEPGDIRSLEDLQKIPPLTKDDIVNNLDSLVASNLSQGEIHRDATGGSTGKHTPFYRDNQCINIKLAAQHRFCTWTGWQLGDRVAMVWPAHQDFAGPRNWKQRIREALVDRQRMLYAGKLNESVLEEHARFLADYRPALIRAFPNPLAILAKHIKERGAASITPRAIVTVGEPLLSSQRKLFESVFGCPVFDCYVSRECGHLACECEHHLGLHINAECLHLEFDVAGRPAEPDELGHVLVTDFENYGMPFIRYRIGDLGSPMTGECRCGRSLPRMSLGAGRESDFVVSPHDGSLVSGATLCHYLLVEGPDVGQVQIIQDACDHLLIRVRAGDSRRLDELSEQHVHQTIHRIFHGRMRATLLPVDRIDHEPSGKYRFCINRLSGASAYQPVLSN